MLILEYTMNKSRVEHINWLDVCGYHVVSAMRFSPFNQHIAHTVCIFFKTVELTEHKTEK